MLNGKGLSTKLLQVGLATKDQIRGCDEAEIDDLAQRYNVTLPAVYKDFLRTVGHGAGRFLKDVSVFYDEVKDLTGRVERDFRGILVLPKKAFVFADRMGEVILFFIADGQCEDPPIYCWSESREGIERVFDSFWQFIEDELGAY